SRMEGSSSTTNTVGAAPFMPPPWARAASVCGAHRDCDEPLCRAPASTADGRCAREMHHSARTGAARSRLPARTGARGDDDPMIQPWAYRPFLLNYDPANSAPAAPALPARKITSSEAHRPAHAHHPCVSKHASTVPAPRRGGAGAQQSARTVTYITL